MPENSKKESICLLVPPQGQPVWPEVQPARPEAQLARPEAQPARPESQPARPEAQLARPNAEPARPEAEAWLEYMVWGMFWSFSGLRGPPRALVGSQLDNLVFLEKSRIKIVLWDGLTMGKFGVSPMEGGQRDI